MLICQILLQPAWLHASLFCPVDFFLYFTNSFYGYTWTLEEEETLIWLQRPVPLQLLAHNYNSSVDVVHCLLFKNSYLSTHLWDPVPISTWLHHLTYRPSDKPLCTLVLHQLQLFCASSPSSHHRTTWHPPRINLHLSVTSSCPFMAFSATSYGAAPLTSPFTSVAELEPLPLICSHELPMCPQALRSLPCEPPSLLGHILEKSWILVDRVQGPGKLAHFSTALKTLRNARKALCLSPADSLRTTPCASIPNTSHAINPHLSELS